mmetsp:Transcript_46509/g.83855  ORF Transcript_46509/g.83855 Transcript_46509/m.83855 type:complete len:217 (-) Transcript_46509:169-819(-)
MMLSPFADTSEASSFVGAPSFGARRFSASEVGSRRRRGSPKKQSSASQASAPMVPWCSARFCRRTASWGSATMPRRRKPLPLRSAWQTDFRNERLWMLRPLVLIALRRRRKRARRWWLRRWPPSLSQSLDRSRGCQQQDQLPALQSPWSQAWTRFWQPSGSWPSSGMSSPQTTKSGPTARSWRQAWTVCPACSSSRRYPRNSTCRSLRLWSSISRL